jgi:putative endopeptidase
MAHEVGAFAKGRKCPCCNNPWNGIEDADIILGSTMNKNVNMLSCEPCLADNKGYKGLDPSNMDPSISCKENFYLYSNGMWKKNNEIPAEYSSWNTFIKLRDMNLDRLKVIVDELLSADSTASDDEQKLADFYSTALDENITESIGINALRELIDICKEASTNVTSAISKLHSRYGIRVLFSLSSSPDKKNSEHTIASISQSGIGLPDRDYYFDADKEDKREKYMIYIESLLALLYQGDPSLICYSTSMKRKLAAKEVLLLETALASAFLTRTECRDPELTYNKMTVDELKSLTKNITQWSTYLTRGVNITEVSWDEYFSSVGRASSELGDINVSMIKALQQINDTINHPSFYHYLVFHCLNSYAPHLPAAFVDVHFNFHEKELKGTAAQKPRWKRALEALEEALGDSLGVCYVMRYFSGDAKDRALRIVEQVRDALRSRLQEVDWMQNDTKVHHHFHYHNSREIMLIANALCTYAGRSFEKDGKI